MSQPPHRYHAYYCEENVWQLAQDPSLPAVHEPHVVFVSNPTKSVALWEQRAGSPIVWDYHVVFLARQGADWLVRDLDSTAGFPLRAADWATASFPLAGVIPPELEPNFRVIDADEFVRDFRSDRRHMQNDQGWLAPPPPWAPISADESNLWDYVDMVHDGPGEIFDLDEFLRRFQ